MPARRRRVRPQFRPSSHYGPGDQRHGRDIRAAEVGRTRTGTRSPESVPTVRETRVPYIPNPGLSRADEAAMRECITMYGVSIILAGRHAGQDYELEGVIYLPLDVALHRVAATLAQWGRFAPNVDVDVPVPYT